MSYLKLNLKEESIFIKKLFLISITVLFILFPNCQPNPTFHYEIDVPFIANTNGVSASSAIAMWSAYDGVWTGQDFILPLILNPDGTVNHNMMVSTINACTDSVGWKSSFSATDAGQNSALSGVSKSLQYHCCSIIPLIGNHYVPVVMAEGRWVNGEPRADIIAFHAYDAPDIVLVSAPLKNTFYRPIGGKYIAFLGRRAYMNEGLDDYNWFVSEGGTYLGAPRDYEPPVL